MANSFGNDVLVQAEDPVGAAAFYVEQLGFEVTDVTPNLVSLHGEYINLHIERGLPIGPVLEVMVASVDEAKARLKKCGCKVIKDEPRYPRCYIQDPFGVIYNLKE
ncbi:MAG: hypothetical protein P4L46_05080 [Fimbriimonas sp.]|nr:hypothetical protein [Fimbriimonas sp.]